MSYLMSGSDPAPQRLGFRAGRGDVQPHVSSGGEDYGGHPSDEQMHLSKKVLVIGPTMHGIPFSEPHFRAGVPSPQATEPYGSCKEPGCTAGGEWQAIERTSVCICSRPPSLMTT